MQRYNIDLSDKKIAVTGAAGAISRGQSALIRSPAVRGFAGFGGERDFIAARGGVSGGYWGLVFD